MHPLENVRQSEMIRFRCLAKSVNFRRFIRAALLTAQEAVKGSLASAYGYPKYNYLGTRWLGHTLACLPGFATMIRFA